MKKYIYTIIAALMLCMTAEAQVLKGTLRIDDKDVAAEFLKLSDNSVAVGNGRNACISQYVGNGLLTIPGEVNIDGTDYRVTRISRFAFRLCNSLTGVNIQENIEKIEEYAFIGCSSIHDITLPASLQTIGAGAFASCYDALKTVTCLSDKPAQWEGRDVFRHITGDDLIYSYDKQLFVANKENYAQADGWKFFPNVKFGQGTYYVYDATDLTLLRDRTDMGNTMAYISDVVLANDIDMTGVTWSHGMGVSEEEPFIAHFDGQGHTITGLTVKTTDCPAFISHYGGGLIENVTFRNCKSMNPTPTGYSAIVVGESGRFMLSNVWLENCTVEGGQYMGGLIGHSITPGMSINDCVVKDIDMKPYPQLGVKSGALVGLAASGEARRCAVIGKYNVTVDLTEFPDVYSSPFLDILGVARPFVAKCTEGDQFQMHSSYASKDYFKDYTIPDFMVYDSDVVIAGHKTIDIIDTDGSTAQLTLGENDMQSLFMAGVLGRQWTYAEDQYPLPDAFGDHFPVEVNKATYCFNATSADDIPVNRLFSRTAQPKDFLNLSADGYSSKEYETSKVWIDDNFTSGEGMLPIGTATITCNDGVIYDRTLQATTTYTAIEKAQLVDADENGEMALTTHGECIPVGDQVIISQKEKYLAKGHSVCLPFDIRLGGTTRVFLPTAFGSKDNLVTVSMKEADRVEAWKPCIVTVAQEAVPLTTEAPVIIRPRTADCDFAPTVSRYAMIGSYKRTGDDSRIYFALNDNERWSKVASSDVLPFRAYFTATDGNGNEQISTGMGYRAELAGDTLTFCWGLPADEELKWWPLPEWPIDSPTWTDDVRHIHTAYFDDSFAPARPTSLCEWFMSCEYLDEILGLENLNTSETTDMQYLFSGCKNLMHLDIAGFNTSKLKNTSHMFAGCEALTTVIIGKDWDMQHVTKSNNMFLDCFHLVGENGQVYTPTCDDKNYANNLPWGYLWKRYPYYCATLNSSNVLVFYGSDTAPDGTTTFDVTNTGNARPDWEYHLSSDVKRAHFLQSFTLARPTSCHRWFASSDLTSITGLKHLNTSQVTDMSSMFEGCQATSLDVEDFDTHNVTDMSSMFKDCSQLTSLDVSHFNTSLVTTMENMFSGCEQLASLDVTGLKTFNVETMQGMFSECKALTELDLNNFNIGKLGNIATMFLRCSGLKTIWCDNSWGDIAQSANMFALCNSLKGAVPYEESTTTLDGRMANPETGYFTATPAVNLYDQEDNSNTLSAYAGQKVNVNYDRVLRATQNADGTWSSKAYTICLPYDLNIVKNWVNGKANVYMLYAINNDKEFIFSNSMDGGVLEAGHAYLVVVHEGEVSLNANHVVLTDQPHEGMDVELWDSSAENVIAGKWRGTFTKIESADAAAMFAYSLQSDGSFKRIRPDTPWAWWGAFRSMFCANAFTGNNVYKAMYQQWIAGNDDDAETVGFPSDDYEGDTEIPDSGTGILHVIDNDGTHRYFDLQGRPLPGKPMRKGLYINNGSKIIYK